MSCPALPEEASRPDPLRSSAAFLSHRSLSSSLLSTYFRQRQKFYTKQAWDELLELLTASNTLYVGNLSFFTRESQIYEHFSRFGRIVKVIMGLNKQTMTPTGFCFIEFASHRETENARLYASAAQLDERTVALDLELPFEENRRFGRGKGGGQIIDDFRASYDKERGGWSRFQTDMKERRERMRKAQQDSFETFQRGSQPARREEEDLLKRSKLSYLQVKQQKRLEGEKGEDAERKAEMAVAEVGERPKEQEESVSYDADEQDQKDEEHISYDDDEEEEKGNKRGQSASYDDDEEEELMEKQASYSPRIEEENLEQIDEDESEEARRRREEEEEERMREEEIREQEEQRMKDLEGEDEQNMERDQDQDNAADQVTYDDDDDD